MHLDWCVLVILGAIAYYSGKHKPNEMPGTLTDAQTSDEKFLSPRNFEMAFKPKLQPGFRGGTRKSRRANFPANFLRARRFLPIFSLAGSITKSCCTFRLMCTFKNNENEPMGNYVSTNLFTNIINRFTLNWRSVL